MLRAKDAMACSIQQSQPRFLALSPGHTPPHPAGLQTQRPRGMAAGETKDSRDWEFEEQRKERRKRN